MRKILNVKSCAAAAMTLLAAGSLYAAGPVDSLREFLGHFSQPATAAPNGNAFENCTRDELQVFDMENSLLTPWKAAWTQKDLRAFDKLVVGAGGRSLALFPALGAAGSSFDKIQAFTWPVPGTNQSVADRLGEYKKNLRRRVERRRLHRAPPRRRSALQFYGSRRPLQHQRH